MSSTRGSAAPDRKTQAKLFAASSGYCQNPSCSNELFLNANGDTIHIAEMAHVFAASERGPRANPQMTKSERGAFENLIMLCSNCHTMIDKAPDAFPDDLILSWKANHALRLRELFGVARYVKRSQARSAIEPLLSENYSLIQQYGPNSSEASNPESGAAEKWKRKMLSRILPNNRRIMTVLYENLHLLLDDEKRLLELFRQHTDDLVAFHIEGEKENASQFPPEFSSILKG